MYSLRWWAETETPVWRWWPAGSCWPLVWSACCSALGSTGSWPAAPLRSRPCCLQTQHMERRTRALKEIYLSTKRPTAVCERSTVSQNTVCLVSLLSKNVATSSDAINKRNGFMKVVLPEVLKAEPRVLNKTMCVGGGGWRKNRQKFSHASIPVRGSLKLCVSSALNYCLCKSDCMNNGFTLAFAGMTLRCQTNWRHRTKRLISGLLHPLCVTWIVCFCKII